MKEKLKDKVIRLKNVKDIDIKEVEKFLKDKKIDHQVFDSAFQAWTWEEAEESLSRILQENDFDIYNDRQKYIAIKDIAPELANDIGNNDDLYCHDDIIDNMTSDLIEDYFNK